MRVLIAESSRFHKDSITTWLRMKGSCEEIIEVNNCDEALHIFGSQSIDMAILGEHVHPVGQGKWILDLKKVAPDTNATFVAIISSSQLPNLTNLASIGALSVLHFNDAMNFFCEITKESAPKSSYFSPYLHELMGTTPKTNHPLQTLSPAERKVASLIAQGLSNEEISDILFISPHTVSDHRKHIKKKLEVTGGKQTLLYFLRPYTIWLISTAK